VKICGRVVIFALLIGKMKSIKTSLTMASLLSHFLTIFRGIARRFSSKGFKKNSHMAREQIWLG